MVVYAPAASASPHAGGRAGHLAGRFPAGARVELHAAPGRGPFADTHPRFVHESAAIPRYVPPSPRYTPPAARYIPPAPHYTPPVPHYTVPVPHYTVPVPHYTAPVPHITVAPATHAASVTEAHVPPGWARSDQRHPEAARADRAGMWRNGENDRARLRRDARSRQATSLHSAAASFTPVTVQPAGPTTPKAARSDTTAKADGTIRLAQPARANRPAKANSTARANPPATANSTAKATTKTKLSTPAAASGAAPLRPVVAVAIPGTAPVVEPVVDYRPAPSVVAPAHRAAPPSRPAVSRPAAPEETFPGAFGEPMVLARGAWQGLSLQAATELKIPISLLVAVGVFLLVQALVDRRDPKVAAAPEHGTDDTVGFQ